MKNFKQDLITILGRLLLFDIKDTLAMQYLSPLNTNFLPWVRQAMRPSGVVKVLNEIVINRRRKIVECGGGISTIYIARLLKDKGGHLYTIEHDHEWANILKNILEEENLSQFVSIIIAPLKKTDLAIHETPWYDEDIIRKEIFNQKIDLLLVDGPPAYTASTIYARYPAVPFFKEFFAENFSVFLDDINRAGEQEILLRWEKQLKIPFKEYLIDGGVAIAQSKETYGII